MVANIITGLMGVLSLKIFLMMNIGVLAGMVFGSIPGLTVLMAIVLLLPLTFGMDALSGMMVLLGAYCGGNYAGSIPAILMNTPGTPAAAATLIEGYQLTKKGKARKALEMALYASVIAGLISCFSLLIVAPLIAKVAIEFGPAEFFSLALFGLCIIVSLSAKNLVKGLISGVIGIYISMIGIDPIMGIPRLSFGSYDMMAGISLVPALVGIFSISEVMAMCEKFFLSHFIQDETENLTDEQIYGEGLTKQDKRSCRKTIIKSSFIGVLVGAIPGTGAILATFTAYDEAKRTSKTPEEFGHGCLEGVSATEAANNGLTGATLIPMMTLGIPGDIVTAVMMGALIMHGLPVGPALFTDHAALTYSIIIGLFIVNLFMLIQAKYYIKVFSKVRRINRKLFVSLLLLFCVIGAFSVNSSIFDVYVMLAFGLMGYVFTKFDIPLAPIILALVLGPLAETSLRRALIISRGSYLIFVTKPLSLVFILISVASLVMSLSKQNKKYTKLSVEEGIHEQE